MKVFNSITKIQPSVTEEAYAPTQQAVETPLVEGVGTRNVTLMRDQQGRVDVFLSAPPCYQPGTQWRWRQGHCFLGGGAGT